MIFSVIIVSLEPCNKVTADEEPRNQRKIKLYLETSNCPVVCNNCLYGVKRFTCF